MNLIILKPDEIDATSRITLTGRRAGHLLDVLHVQTGQSVRIGILNGDLGSGQIESMTDRAVTLHVELTGQPPPEPSIDVLLALPRPKVIKRLWAPLASLGIRRIFVTNAAKVPRNYFDTHWIDPERFTPLLLEGLEQAADTRLPDVRMIRRLKPFIEDELDTLCPDTRRIIAHPTPDLSVPAPPTDGRRTVLAIGPEGGWTPFELTLFAAHGFLPYSLGPRRLRTDVACIALIARLQATT